MLGLSPATLSQVENGRTGLSVNRLSQIAEALGLTAAQILGRAVEPESPSRRFPRAVAATVPAGTRQPAVRTGASTGRSVSIPSCRPPSASS